MKNTVLLFAVFAAFFAACKDDDPVTPADDYSVELAGIGEDVILKTYLDLDTKAGTLVSVLTTLENAQTTQNLDAARQAWRDTRLPWEQSEGFLFGPVTQKAIDPAMDSWPVNTIDLDNVLSSGQALTKEFIDLQDGTVKGFHTIEYLLFGLDGTKSVASFNPREFEYLRACAQSLKGETFKLYNAWNPAGENYIINILHAGTTQSNFKSQKAALQEIVNGMIGIADEVGNSKINDPYSQQNVTLEESRFSANSKSDFTDNIRSIRNAYFGSTDGSVATGLSTMVQSKNPALDTKIKAEISAAIAAIENIPGTFTTAIFNNTTAVEDARTKVRNLQETLQAELFTFVQEL